MRRRFFLSMVAVAGLTITLLVGVATVVSSRTQRNAMETSLVRSTEAVATEIAAVLDDTGPAQIGEVGFGPNVARVLEQARRSTDNQIGLIFRTPRQERATAPWLTELAGQFDLEHASTRWVETEQGLAFARSVPLERFGGDVVVVAARESPVLDLSDELRLIVAGLVLSAVVAAVAARLLSSWVVRRIQPLASGALALSEGDWSARVPLDGNDEVTDVSKSFNEMAEALEGSRERERQFLLSVGHDLRTPLTTIGGYAEALEDGVEDPAEVARIAGVMTTENRRLRRLIEDVMLLARVDNSEFGVRPESVDVAGHISGVAAGYVDRAAAAHVELVVDTPSVGSRLVDPDRMGQILSNLLENALRYTPETGVISVQLSSTDDSVSIEVSDTGAGIEGGDLPSIFDRFYVAKRYRGVRPEGSGLGLSIVERLATTMGGSVTARSRVGEGTTFRVELPAPPL